MKLYRVTKRSTRSLQPGGGGATTWNRETLYCGGDRDEARRVYHDNTCHERGGGYGNHATEIICEVIKDAETEDFHDDEVSTPFQF